MKQNDTNSKIPSQQNQHKFLWLSYYTKQRNATNTFTAGCNLYCLDKNYGGFLIIWDRIFGTFAEEHKREEIIYGLVYNQPSFNPVFLQVSVKRSSFTYF